MYPEYSDNEINEMRAALILSGDLDKIYGETQSSRYKITESGKVKIHVE